MSIIERLNKGFSNSALRAPYTTGVLDCGHHIEVEKQQCHYECRCSFDFWHETNGTVRCEICGGSSFKVLASTNPHDEDHHYRHVGDEVYCRRCHNNDRELAALRAAVEAGEVHHTRQKSWCGVSQIHAYRLDPKSPSNFMLITSVEETPKVREFFKSLGRSGLTPLSPTERA